MICIIFIVLFNKIFPILHKLQRKVNCNFLNILFIQQYLRVARKSLKNRFNSNIQLECDYS